MLSMKVLAGQVGQMLGIKFQEESWQGESLNGLERPNAKR